MPKTNPHADAIAEARAAQAVQLAKQVLYADFNARLMRSRAEDPADPLTDDVASAQEGELSEAKTKARAVAKSAGSTLAKSLNAAKPAWSAEMAERVAAWRSERAVHQDLIEHPDAYGGVMLDGVTPIDVEREAEFLRAFDAAIAEAERTIG